MAANVAGRSATFTSLSALGASQPLSPSQSQGAGGGASQGRLGKSRGMLGQGWRWILLLFHPNASQMPSSTSARTLSSVVREERGEIDDERTPLLRRSGTGRRRQKYVGGGCVWGDPFAGGSDVECQTCIQGYGTDGNGDLRAVRADCTSDQGQTTSGMVLAAVSQTFYAIMSMMAATLGRKLSYSINAFQWLTVHSFALSLITTVTLLSVGRRDFVFGPKGARVWHWCRATCNAGSCMTFVVAAQGLPACDVVAIVFVAPVVYNIASQLLFASRHPFQAQLVSLSIWLGLVLLVQPELGQDAQSDDELTVAAAPIDLAPLINSDMKIAPSWAFAAAISSAILSFFSFALVDRAPRQGHVTGHHTIFSASLLTMIAAFCTDALLTNDWYPTTSLEHTVRAVFTSAASSALAVGVVLVSFCAKAIQETSLLRTGACRMGVLSFVQPLLGTGVGVLADDDFVVGDVLPLAGCLLIVVNLAWIFAPLEDDDDDDVNNAGRGTGTA